MILSCLGFLVMDRQTDERMDIAGCRVAFATENILIYFIKLLVSFVSQEKIFKISEAKFCTPANDRARSAHRARARARSIRHSKAEILTFPMGSHAQPSDTIQRISVLPLAGPQRVTSDVGRGGAPVHILVATPIGKTLLLAVFPLYFSIFPRKISAAKT